MQQLEQIRKNILNQHLCLTEEVVDIIEAEQDLCIADIQNVITSKGYWCSSAAIKAVIGYFSVTIYTGE